MTEPQATPPQDFAAVAGKIWTWTTRGLLSAVVLVAGLAFGRQVLRWWADETPVALPVAAPADRLGNLALPHTIEFGDSPWSMRRQSISGDRRQAVERLRAVCREMLDTVSPLPLGEGPGVRAADFLASLEQTKPTAESPGRWRLYELHESFPMAVGIAKTPSRVVLWGMAIPAAPNGWTLCVFQPGGEGGGKGDSPIFADTKIGTVPKVPQKIGAVPGVPLPPGARRTMTLRASDGGAITVFSGNAAPSRWISFYDDWSDKNGWRKSVDWQSIGPAWHARYVESDRDGGSLDVRFGPDNRGGFHGLLMLSPRESR